ncbi:MAG: glutathione S-transferase [Hydrogenophaga sp.]|uniref:glutathione transferase n=1 Tax=Hydrogenophaga crocea TaxID=2716225 RepID=A0A6G8ILR8_9BURK|nr:MULTISPECIES: glutathione S-transferase [Hydrogenophaga]MBL0945687.1 glutathione S-transferase [Hydrogenophaga sp.]QIM54043.1 glutathione S-transferase [Hydrogenophaga crocea]
MIRVHHLNHSRSQRVLWLLEELGLPYEIVRYERDPKTMLAPPELKKVHPLGKSPVVTDGPLVLAESGAIIETLVERHGPQLRPEPGTPEFQRYRYWMHYAEGSLMPPLLLKLVFDQVEKAPLIVRPVAKAISATVKGRFITPNLRTHLDFLEAELASSPWFAGPAFSAADVQMSFPIEAAAARGGLDNSRPRLMDWLQRIHDRPAYHRAIDKGGPFELLG